MWLWLIRIELHVGPLLSFCYCLSSFSLPFYQRDPTFHCYSIPLFLIFQTFFFLLPILLGLSQLLRHTITLSLSPVFCIRVGLLLILKMKMKSRVFRRWRRRRILVLVVLPMLYMPGIEKRVLKREMMEVVKTMNVVALRIHTFLRTSRWWEVLIDSLELSTRMRMRIGMIGFYNDRGCRRRRKGDNLVCHAIVKSVKQEISCAEATKSIYHSFNITSCSIPREVEIKQKKPLAQKNQT